MEWLGKPILQLACRHHTGELHILHTYLECRGNKYTKSDTNSLYKRLHTAWKILEPLIKSYPEQLLKWNVPAIPDWRCDRADEVLAWSREMMLNGSFRRVDHRELLELCVQYLGGVVVKKLDNGDIKEGFSMRRPIATNQSRFMGTAIHELKIAMVLKPGWFELDGDAAEETEAMAEFISLLWAPYFLQSRLASAAPRLDRDLWVDLQQYKACFLEDSMQAAMVEAAMTSLLRHSWYLTQELVVFALWDSSISNAEKRAIAMKIASIPPPPTWSTTKPELLTLLPRLPSKPKLKDMVGERSHLVFHLLQVGSNWLRQPVRAWSIDLEYVRVGDFLNQLQVVNDSAERCIKDITEYRDRTKDSEYREDILLVVNDFRHVFHDKRKEAMARINYL